LPLEKDPFSGMLKKVLPYFLLLFSSLQLFGQNATDSIQKALLKYQQFYPQEKAYLHLDKPYYAVGDTIWFKAYLVDASSHIPDSASGVLYIDLFRADGTTVVTHKTCKVLAGFSSGELALADSLREGVYKLRAYTAWMRNFPDRFFFQKQINVYKQENNTNSIADRDLARLTKAAHVQFFPEGGNMVAGLQNRIGFKCTNEAGIGIDFSGYIIADLKDTITFVKSQHLGMGHFLFIPQKGKTYQLTLNEKSTGIQQFKLPEPQNEGYAIMVDNMNKTAIKVFTRNNFAQPDRPILVAHQRGQIVYAAQVTSDKNAHIFIVPKEVIPHDGVVQLTLFNRDGVPQAERIVYIRKGNPLQVKFSLDKSIYHPREKTVLDITVTDNAGYPVEGNFSLSVTDSKQIKASRDAENIETYFLLSSDIDAVNTAFDNEVKGVVEQPGYYFDKNNPNAAVHLDILLMTQGWRRFLWKNVLSKTGPAITHGFEKGITVSGQVLQLNGKPSKKVVDLSVLYSSKKGGNGFFSSKANENGKFIFSDLDFTDTTTLVVQGTKSNGTKNLNVQLDPPSIPEIAAAHNPFPPSGFNRDEIESYLKRQKEYQELENQLRFDKVQTLKAVEIEAKREEPDSRRISYGQSARTIKVDNNMCAGVTNVLQMLQGKIAGVQVTGNGMNMSATVRNRPVTFVLDGMPLYDATMISTISPCDVEAIDILTSSVMVAGGGPSIAILTRRGNPNYDWTQEKAAGVSVSSVMGFDVSKEFYSPSYEVPPTAKIPDYRSTVYWNPMITTDKNGKAQVVFWNTDEKGTIRAALEGMSFLGEPVVGSAEYNVN
jgi:hypothetical protein